MKSKKILNREERQGRKSLKIFLAFFAAFAVNFLQNVQDKLRRSFTGCPISECDLIFDEFPPLGRVESGIR